MSVFSVYSALSPLYLVGYHMAAPHDPRHTELASQAPHAVLLSAGGVDGRTVGCTRTAPSKF
jgi:hypothetical protein